MDPAQPEEAEVTETIEPDALDPILEGMPSTVPDPPVGDAGQPSAPDPPVGDAGQPSAPA